jgi:hypothetical protein
MEKDSEIKQLMRMIAFMRSLGGLYENIADDAQEELDRLLATIKQKQRLYECMKANIK